MTRRKEHQDLSGKIHKLKIGKVNLYIQLFQYQNKLTKVLIRGAHHEQDTRQFLAGVQDLINLCISYSIPSEEIYNCISLHRGETEGFINFGSINGHAVGILDAIGKLLKKEYPEGKKKREA